jgi:chromosome segregation protein
LLKLRKVEVLGFKSFLEKTHITFSGTGLTCIVGPNGCGKSNIVDAISWVLGEQSHKSLRAERMADCIFAGTAKRPPMGMAEVIITLEDPELVEAGKFFLTGIEEETAAEATMPAVATADGAAAESGQLTAQQPSAVAGNVDAAAIEELPEGAGPNTIILQADEVMAIVETGETEKPGPELVEKGAPAFLAKKKKAAKQHQHHAKPGQVVIGRRLYRSGQSEYLINGRVARLRDVQELFMGVGLGPDSYAIIEQGRIGMILSSKPSDRRAIIEEAAGITKYKTKKRLAEAKLESSKLNLNRVNDIVVEVEKQLASLKRQASKARRYAEIREQMRGLLRQVMASKALEMDREAERLAALFAETSALEAAETQNVAALEAEQEKLSARTYELDAELRQNQNLLGQATLELDRAENRIAFNKRRGEEIDARAQHLAGQLVQAASQVSQAEERAAQHEQGVAALRTENAQIEELVAEASVRGYETDAKMQEVEARIAEMQRLVSEWGEQLHDLHGEHAHATEALAHHTEALIREQAREHAMLGHSAELSERDRAAELHLQEVAERAKRLGAEVVQLQARTAELRQNEQELRARSETLRDELASVRARRSTLEQVLNDRAYTADAVKKLFAANAQAGESGRDFKAVGLLADYAEVEERYEAAIEQFMRDELEYVIVETFDYARTGISMLREELGGRATFFVDSLNKLQLEPEDQVIPFPTAEGVVSRLDRLMEFRDPLGAAAKRFLPRLKSAYLVETAAAAEKLARTYPAYSFVTPDGTTYQGRMVSGGRAAEAGPLGMKRELRALEAEHVQREQEMAEAQARLAELAAARSECEAHLARITAEHIEAEKQLVAATHQRDQARGEFARTGAELAQCQAEIDRLKREVEAAQVRAEQAERQRAATAESRTNAEQEIATLGEFVAQLRQTAETQQQELAAKREEAAKLAERLATAEMIANRLEEERREAAARADELRAQQESLAAEHAQVQTESDEQARRLESLRAEKERLEGSKVTLEEEWDQSRSRTAHVDDALRTARQKVSDLREQRSHVEIERARNDSERSHLRETCMAELNLQPEDLMAEFPALLSGEELAIADANYKEMRAKIEAMGPVNMMALEEYNECDQRYGFLTRERDDLLASIADTQQAITELDQVSRQKFEEAFAAINSAFTEAFRALFGGGTGEMRLTEPDSSGDPGIDVVAQPPGKRLQNVVLLSGGEKALTALALLIAIFKFQPSPFCILDEVDAPLDEANVGRFADMVAHMGSHTQFIVVTHNRRTMEMAPVLYGVTMQEPGVSKLVSVRWNEDQQAAKTATNAA